MPPCTIAFGANEHGVGYIEYTFEGYEPLKITPFVGHWPQPEEIQELWAMANDPKEREPLRLVKDDEDGNQD
jgi:hypothetical protein